MVMSNFCTLLHFCDSVCEQSDSKVGSLFGKFENVKSGRCIYRIYGFREGMISSFPLMF